MLRRLISGQLVVTGHIYNLLFRKRYVFMCLQGAERKHNVKTLTTANSKLKVFVILLLYTYKSIYNDFINNMICVYVCVFVCQCSWVYGGAH